jgi:hypothetical protein
LETLEGRLWFRDTLFTLDEQIGCLFVDAEPAERRWHRFHGMVNLYFGVGLVGFVSPLFLLLRPATNVLVGAVGLSLV